MNRIVQPRRPIPDPDELPDDMDLDDRVEARASAPPDRAGRAASYELDIASAQRPPADS